MLTKFTSLFIAVFAAMAATQVDARRKRARTFRIRFRNIAYLQPMSPFLVSVHNKGAKPLFEVGLEASPELGFLAETGDAAPLRDAVLEKNKRSVADVTINPFNATGTPGPLFRGPDNFVDVMVTMTPFHKLFSFASMAVNTNDCFVGATNVLLKHGLTFTVPGFDSGTEENNEDCSSVPGPACPMDSGNVASGNGEGVIGIHRGIHGMFEEMKTDLKPEEYDWRNPMVSVEVTEMGRGNGY